MITRLRSAILCDDVRTEDNGKAIFIGVYGNGLLTSQRPAVIRGYLALAFDVDATENPIEFRVSALTSRVDSMMVKGGGGFAAVIIPLQVALTEPRELRAEVRNEGGDWMWAGEWQLGFTDTAEDAPAEVADRIREMATSLQTEASV